MIGFWLELDATLLGVLRYIYTQVSAQEAQTILDGDVARVLTWIAPFHRRP